MANMNSAQTPKSYVGSSSLKMWRNGQLKSTSPRKKRKDHISLPITLNLAHSAINRQSPQIEMETI